MPPRLLANAGRMGWVLRVLSQRVCQALIRAAVDLAFDLSSMPAKRRLHDIGGPGFDPQAQHIHATSSPERGDTSCLDVSDRAIALVKPHVISFIRELAHGDDWACHLRAALDAEGGGGAFLRFHLQVLMSLIGH